MSYNHFYKSLDSKARAAFPSLKNHAEVEWDLLISPLEIKLPKLVKETAANAIRALYKISRNDAYRSALEQIPGISAHPPRNRSVLMAYDFHTDEAGGCHLVEVNTNASGFMIAALMESTHRQAEVADFAPFRLLRDSFQNELRLCGCEQASPQIAIADDEIDQQKMRIEFLMYRDWFEAAGWRPKIVEAKELNPDEFDLTYNRSTDFYFEEDQHARIRNAYLQGSLCVTPNPYEYWLLGDKQRLIQLGQESFLIAAGASPEDISAIQKVIIPTFDKALYGPEEAIWADRKQLFFKPKRSHGGKSVYRGESVSRKVFERLMAEDILIQRFVPAQKMPTDDPRSVLSNWKFDLRFYVYEDEIQLAVARIYQGQVTNFSSPMGGFTLVGF